jgi:hypothetical protein
MSLELPAYLQPAALAAASARRMRQSLGAGAVVVVLAHAAIGAAVVWTPRDTAHAAASQASAGGDDASGCASVISPACLGEKRPRGPLPPAKDDEITASRRCPEPLRRLLRREVEPPPSLLVDLLEAEIVERLGERDGTVVPSGPKAEAKPETVEQKRVETVAKLVRGETAKLDTILKGGAQGEERRSKLGKILGTATGQKGGDGLVSRKGSAYVREVRIAMQQNFVLPGNVPPWLRKELRAKVRITRMTATGKVLEYSVIKKSGNPAFDDTVAALLASYRAGIRSLPEPPPHVLDEINSRGLVIDLRGG